MVTEMEKEPPDPGENHDSPLSGTDDNSADQPPSMTIPISDEDHRLLHQQILKMVSNKPHSKPELLKILRHNKEISKAIKGYNPTAKGRFVELHCPNDEVHTKLILQGIWCPKHREWHRVFPDDLEGRTIVTMFNVPLTTSGDELGMYIEKNGYTVNYSYHVLHENYRCGIMKFLCTKLDGATILPDYIEAYRRKIGIRHKEQSDKQERHNAPPADPGSDEPPPKKKRRRRKKNSKESNPEEPMNIDGTNDLRMDEFPPLQPSHHGSVTLSEAVQMITEGYPPQVDSPLTLYDMLGGSPNFSQPTDYPPPTQESELSTADQEVDNEDKWSDGSVEYDADDLDTYNVSWLFGADQPPFDEQPIHYQKYATSLIVYQTLEEELLKQILPEVVSWAALEERADNSPTNENIQPLSTPTTHTVQWNNYSRTFAEGEIERIIAHLNEKELSIEDTEAFLLSFYKLQINGIRLPKSWTKSIIEAFYGNVLAYMLEKPDIETCPDLVKMFFMSSSNYGIIRSWKEITRQGKTRAVFNLTGYFERINTSRGFTS